MSLSKQQAADIKVALAAGQKQDEIAEKYSVSRGAISNIATGRAHADVPWPDGAVPRSTQGKAAPDYDPTDARVQALEAENAALRQERNIAKRAAKAAAHQHGIFKAMADELANVKPLSVIDPVCPINPNHEGIQEDVVMHLSDGHHDQIVTKEESAGLEEYDFLISSRRAEVYVDTVLEWTQQILNPAFKFKVLTVLAYGDHTSGEIHGHVARSYFRNQFKNSFAIGQLHALMYRELAPYFDQVNVLYLPGNHGRRTAKKDFHGAHDNWDYLVACTAKEHCRDHTNIHFAIPNAFSANVFINKVGFNVSHGDDVRGHQGIPFYGMVRRQKGLQALNSAQGGPPIRYHVMGHHHVGASLSDIDGELLVNGAWVGTDSYAYNSFAGYREPKQWLHGVNPRRGITWRMDVQLRTKGENKGPQRYKINIE